MSSTPSHYKGNGTTTCADAMESMMAASELDAMDSYWWGCALKYVWRWPHKGGADDIRKAIDCLTRLLPEEEGVGIQCAECVHCRVDGAAMLCNVFGDRVKCTEVRGDAKCQICAMPLKEVAK